MRSVGPGAPAGARTHTHTHTRTPRPPARPRDRSLARPHTRAPRSRPLARLPAPPPAQAHPRSCLTIRGRPSKAAVYAAWRGSAAAAQDVRHRIWQASRVKRTCAANPSEKWRTSRGLALGRATLLQSDLYQARSPSKPSADK